MVKAGERAAKAVVKVAAMAVVVAMAVDHARMAKAAMPQVRTTRKHNWVSLRLTTALR